MNDVLGGFVDDVVLGGFVNCGFFEGWSGRFGSDTYMQAVNRSMSHEFMGYGGIGLPCATRYRRYAFSERRAYAGTAWLVIV